MYLLIWAGPSQGTKDSLNVRSTVRVCTLLVPWPWFCWCADQGTTTKPPHILRSTKGASSTLTSILILINVLRRRLCIYWESYQHTWYPSKIGKLTFNMQRSSLMGRFWRIFAVSKCRYNLFRCLWCMIQRSSRCFSEYCFDHSKYQCRDWGPLHLLPAQCAV